MYFECLSDIEDEISNLNGNKKLENHKITYTYINFEERILHNEN